MIKFFNNFKKIIGEIYFVNKTDRVGQFWVIIDYKQEKKSYSILVLPENETLFVHDEDLMISVENKTIEKVEKLPLDVFNVCKREFIEKIK